MSTHKNLRALPTGNIAGLGVSNLAKIQLIRKFQRSEGNFDCCASAYIRVCQQFACLWRDDCLKLANDEALRQDGHG